MSSFFSVLRSPHNRAMKEKGFGEDPSDIYRPSDPILGAKKRAVASLSCVVVGDEAESTTSGDSRSSLDYDDYPSYPAYGEPIYEESREGDGIVSAKKAARVGMRARRSMGESFRSLKLKLKRLSKRKHSTLNASARHVSLGLDDDQIELKQSGSFGPPTKRRKVTLPGLRNKFRTWTKNGSNEPEFSMEESIVFETESIAAGSRQKHSAIKFVPLGCDSISFSFDVNVPM